MVLVSAEASVLGHYLSQRERKLLSNLSQSILRLLHTDLRVSKLVNHQDFQESNLYNNHTR